MIGSEFTVGDEWVYRLRDYAPSERVRIDALEPKKTTVRVQVTFVDEGGRTENVPGSRLRVPWAEVDAYDQLQANWERLEDISLDPVEQSVVSQVFEVVIPQDLADYDAPQVLDAMTIYDRDRLADLLGPDILSEIMLQTPWFEIDGKIMVSPKGTLSIAEAACRARLDILLARAIDALKEDQSTLAEILEEEHERERITPERTRPIIDRPLSPSEIPVREVPVRRRWGY